MIYKKFYKKLIIAILVASTYSNLHTYDFIDDSRAEEIYGLIGDYWDAYHNYKPEEDAGSHFKNNLIGTIEKARKTTVFQKIDTAIKEGSYKKVSPSSALKDRIKDKVTLEQLEKKLVAGYNFDVLYKQAKKAKYLNKWAKAGHNDPGKIELYTKILQHINKDNTTGKQTYHLARAVARLGRPYTKGLLVKGGEVYNLYEKIDDVLKDNTVDKIGRARTTLLQYAYLCMGLLSKFESGQLNTKYKKPKKYAEKYLKRLRKILTFYGMPIAQGQAKKSLDEQLYKKAKNIRLEIAVSESIAKSITKKAEKTKTRCTQFLRMFMKMQNEFPAESWKEYLNKTIHKKSYASKIRKHLRDYKKKLYKFNLSEESESKAIWELVRTFIIMKAIYKKAGRKAQYLKYFDTYIADIFKYLTGTGRMTGDAGKKRTIEKRIENLKYIVFGKIVDQMCGTQHPTSLNGILFKVHPNQMTKRITGLRYDLSNQFPYPVFNPRSQKHDSIKSKQTTTSEMKLLMDYFNVAYAMSKFEGLKNKRIELLNEGPYEYFYEALDEHYKKTKRRKKFSRLLNLEQVLYQLSKEIAGGRLTDDVLKKRKDSFPRRIRKEVLSVNIKILMKKVKNLDVGQRLNQQELTLLMNAVSLAFSVGTQAPSLNANIKKEIVKSYDEFVDSYNDVAKDLKDVTKDLSKMCGIKKPGKLDYPNATMRLYKKKKTWRTDKIRKYKGALAKRKYLRELLTQMVPRALQNDIKAKLDKKDSKNLPTSLGQYEGANAINSCPVPQ